MAKRGLLPGKVNNRHVKARDIKCELAAYRNMIHRCYSPVNKQYKDYGGREKPITVCEEWRNDFEAFFRDMGRRPPSPDGSRRLEYSLDRIDNNGNYEPGNCRWATRKEQQANQRNRRTEHTLTVCGVTKHFIDWSRETGIDPCTLRQRYNAGWPEHQLLSPPRTYRQYVANRQKDRKPLSS